MNRSHALGYLAAAGTVALPLRVRAADTLRIAAALEATAVPLLYGIQSGVFRQLGLTIDVQSMSSGAAVSAAVVGGALEIGHTSLLAVLNAHVRGVPLKLIAPGWNYLNSDPRGGLLVQKDAPYRTGRDFTGKTFAASSIGDLKSLIIRAWVDKTGGDSKSIKFVEIPAAAEVPALQSGRIDGIVAFDPWIDIALASGQVRAIADPSEAIASRYLVTGWIARTDYVAANPEIARKFASGMRTSALYANGHASEMAPVLAPFLKQTVADVARARLLPLATALDPREIQPVIDIAARYGAIPNGFPASQLIADAVRGV
jgi:NitT/TauT family transport system substrate-binding protein